MFRNLLEDVQEIFGSREKRVLGNCRRLDSRGSCSLSSGSSGVV